MSDLFISTQSSHVDMLRHETVTVSDLDPAILIIDLD